MNFGSSTLAHRIHNVKPMDPFRRLDETEGNSRDANATEKTYAIHTTANTISFIDVDNGHGMEHLSGMIDPSNKTKPPDMIGSYYQGAFDSLISSNAFTVFVASCW